MTEERENIHAGEVVPLSANDPETPLMMERDRLRQINAAIIRRLERLSVGVTGLEDARIEHLIECLVEREILTPVQSAEIKLDWEKSLNDKLVKMEVDVRRRIAAAQARQAAQPTVVRSHLLGPDGQPTSS